MPDWLLWVALGLVFFAVKGRRGGCGRYRRGHTALEGRRAMDRPAEPRQVEAAPARPSREQQEARLRARFVTGELSLEAYERELDALYARP